MTPLQSERRNRRRRGRGLTPALAVLFAVLPAATVGLGVHAFVSEQMTKGGPPVSGNGRGAEGGAAAARTVASLWAAGAARAKAEDENMSVVATTERRSVRVQRRPGSRRGTRRVAKRPGQKGPLVFLVKRQREGWLEVSLPIRPNGSKGWIRERDVSLAETDYRVRIQLRRHRITVSQGERVVERTKVGVGQAVTPTPPGRYYLTELVKPPRPDGLYGAYAFSLSGFSDVVTSFNGGNGQLGLHGTVQDWGLGEDVSHGCIRVSNPVIRRLAGRLPLGTPVVIER